MIIQKVRWQALYFYPFPLVEGSIVEYKKTFSGNNWRRNSIRLAKSLQKLVQDVEKIDHKFAKF